MRSVSNDSVAVLFCYIGAWFRWHLSVNGLCWLPDALVEVAMFLADPSTSNGWFALAGALGGVVTTGAFAFITALYAHRWRMSEASVEEVRRIKADMFQQRKQAYAEFIGNSNLIWRHLNILASNVRENGPRPDSQELSELISKSEGLRAEIFLLASKPVVEAVRNYDDQLAEARTQARQGNDLPYIYPAYALALDVMRKEMRESDD
jgi:hypothetical protein